MHNPFDRLQRSNIALADERDQLRDMIATLEQESRQMWARNERLEKENIELYSMVLAQARTIRKFQQKQDETK